MSTSRNEKGGLTDGALGVAPTRHLFTHIRTDSALFEAFQGLSIDQILFENEEAALAAAAAYGRLSDAPGICVCSNGLVTSKSAALLERAHKERVPMLVIVMGRVADECCVVDRLGIPRPLYKDRLQVGNPATLAECIDAACGSASAEKNGPVLIELCLGQPIEASANWRGKPSRPPLPTDPNPLALARADCLLRAARAPLLLMAGNVSSPESRRALHQFAVSTCIPSVSTLAGFGVIPNDTPGFLGVVGFGGNKAANRASRQCDLVICAGSCDEGAPHFLDMVSRSAKIVRLAESVEDVCDLHRVDLGLIAPISKSLRQLAMTRREPWTAECPAWEREWQDRHDPPGDCKVLPTLFGRLSAVGGAELLLTCSSAQQLAWAVWYSKTNLSTAQSRGPALRMAETLVPDLIGATFAAPAKKVVAITDVTSLMASIDGLRTIRRYRLPVKFLLLGHVRQALARQWGELVADKCSLDRAGAPDLAKILSHYGIEVFAIDEQAQVGGAISRLFNSEGPVLCHVRVDSEATLWHPFEEMAL